MKTIANATEVQNFIAAHAVDSIKGHADGREFMVTSAVDVTGIANVTGAAEFVIVATGIPYFGRGDVNETLVVTAV